jgi:hypothetical protein
MSLAQLVQERMLALRSLADPDQQRDLIVRTWQGHGCESAAGVQQAAHGRIQSSAWPRH